MFLDKSLILENLMKTDKSDKVIRCEMDAFHPVGVFDKILTYFDIITSDKKNKYV